MNSQAISVGTPEASANDENFAIPAMEELAEPNNIMDLLDIYHAGDDLSAHALYDALAAGVASPEFRRER